MNGAGFGSSYSETFQQQHRIRSMSWCEDGELITSTTNKLKSDCTLLKQDELISSASLIRSDSVELPSCSAEVINLKKPSARKNAWGCLSYADLIAKAIESSPNQRLTLNQIYSWMVENVPYFRAKGQTNSSAGWKNSIRHNLSLHGRFVRVQNEGAGKSSWWMVNNNNRMQKTPRRRSTTMDSKSFEKKRKTSTVSKECNSLESPSLSASVPAFLGSCSQNYQQQSLHGYHQFLHQQRHSHTQPLDSFETAFRPIDRQHSSNFSAKDQNFVAENSNLRYDDNCFNNSNLRSEDIFEISLIGGPVSPGSGKSGNHMTFCSTHSIISKQSDSCQRFALLPQPSTTGLPDFFKLPDEAWRHYLPPSPNGLTETVISSESLTALLETGAESEIIDLVPPSLSTFDESGHDRKMLEELKEQHICTVDSDDASNRMPGPSGDCQSERHKPISCHPHHNSFVSAFINQVDEELAECPPSVLRHVLTSNNTEIHGSVKTFTTSNSSLSLLGAKLNPNFINNVAFEDLVPPSDLAYSTLEGRTLSSDNHNISSMGEFQEESDDKKMPFILPFKMPLNIGDSALDNAAIAATVPLTTICNDNEITVTSKD